MTDNDIIKLFCDRDEQAIRSVEEKYQSYLYKISANILCDEQDVHECLNDTYLSVWNSIPPNRPNAFKVYIGRIIRNISINKLKSQKTKKRGGGQVEDVFYELDECVSTAFDVEESINEKELTLLIEKILRSQPKQKRRLFIKRYWYVNSIKEIATEFNMSEGKVTAILCRMRKDLKIILKTEGFDL